jgi:hypothetical protein
MSANACVSQRGTHDNGQGARAASAASTGQEVSPAASGGGRAEVGAKLKGAGKLRLVNECDKRRVDDARRVQIIKKACVDRQIGRGQGGRARQERSSGERREPASGQRSEVGEQKCVRCTRRHVRERRQVGPGAGLGRGMRGMSVRGERRGESEKRVAKCESVRVALKP